MPIHYVVVRFESEDELDNPANYVEGAVAEMKGCLHPDDPERSIDGDSVHAEALDIFPHSMTAREIVAHIDAMSRGESYPPVESN